MRSSPSEGSLSRLTPSEADMAFLCSSGRRSRPKSHLEHHASGGARGRDLDWLGTGGRECVLLRVGSSREVRSSGVHACLYAVF